MRMVIRLCLGLQLAAIVLMPLLCPRALAGDSDGRVILDTCSFWRVHYTLRRPMIGEAPSQFGFDTDLPPSGWALADFDDGTWRYIPGPPFPPYSNYRTAAKENVGWCSVDKSSAGLGLLCMRGRFRVDDPAAARLKVRVEYRGGLAVYVNGTEIARAHLPPGAKLDELADDYPNEAFFAPDIRWMRHAHSGRKDLRGIGEIGYQCLVWSPRFPSLPDFELGKGWRSGACVYTQCIRSRSRFPINVFHLMCEMNIAGQQRGIGRIGLDFWPVLKGKRGRTSDIFVRFPRSGWRNMDWVMRYCAEPGPQGARLTHRLIVLREGLQECEARTLIERALDAKRISGALAQKAQALLKKRTYLIRVALDNHAADRFGKDAGHAWWSTPGEVGYQWHVASDWQKRSAELYNLAAEVSAHAGH